MGEWRLWFSGTLDAFAGLVAVGSPTDREKGPPPYGRVYGIEWPSLGVSLISPISRDGRTFGTRDQNSGVGCMWFAGFGRS